MSDVVKRYESEGRFFYFDENTPHLPALHFEAETGVWIKKDTWDLIHGMDKENLKALDRILTLAENGYKEDPIKALAEIEQIALGALL